MISTVAMPLCTVNNLPISFKVLLWIRIRKYSNLLQDQNPNPDKLLRIPIKIQKNPIKFYFVKLSLFIFKLMKTCHLKTSVENSPSNNEQIE